MIFLAHDPYRDSATHRELCLQVIQRRGQGPSGQAAKRPSGRADGPHGPRGPGPCRRALAVTSCEAKFGEIQFSKKRKDMLCIAMQFATTCFDMYILRNFFFTLVLGLGFAVAAV